MSGSSLIPSTGVAQPLTILMRIFPGDSKLWYWEVKWWKGDVDTMHTEPTGHHEAPKGHSTYTEARRAADLYARGIV